MNKFFATVADRITASTDCGAYQQLDPPEVETLNNFSNFTVDGLLEILGELSINKSSGIDGLPTSIIFDAIRAKPDIFVKICNKSLETGVFLNHCKLARIKIIPKKGDIRMLDNLHPISILLVIGKILEKKGETGLGQIF